MNIIKNSENKLAKIYNQKHCILTGRAATALWISFSLISPKKNKVMRKKAPKIQKYILMPL